MLEINTSMIGGRHSLYTPQNGVSLLKTFLNTVCHKNIGLTILLVVNIIIILYINLELVLWVMTMGARIMYDNVLSNLGFILSSKAMY